MAESLVGAFRAMATSRADTPAIIEKRYGKWVERSAGQIASEAAALAKGLAELGIGQGQTVVLVLKARLEWVTLDLAVQAVGAKSAALPARLREADLGSLIAESRAATVVVEGQDEADLVLTAYDAGQLPEVTRIIYVDGAGVSDYASELLHSIDELRTDGGDLGTFAAALDEGATAALVPSHNLDHFTSVSHAALAAAARSTIEAAGLGPKDRVVAVRDAADPVERGATIYAALLSGALLAIPESSTTVDLAIHEIAPTYVHVTERWLAHNAARITVRFDENRGIKKWVAASWRKRTGSTIEHYGSGRPPRGLWRFVVSVPVLEELGLEKSRVVVVSGDPSPGELLGFYAALGLPLRTALAVSELAGFATMGAPREVDGWVGAAAPGVEVVVEDSRVVVTTAATGRIATTLAGEVLDEGFVVNGSSSEEAAETRLRATPAFSSAMVSTDASAVLIELDGAIASRWAAKNHLDAATYRSFAMLDEMSRGVESAVGAALTPLGLEPATVTILTAPLEEIPGALSFGDVPRRDIVAD